MAKINIKSEKLTPFGGIFSGHGAKILAQIWRTLKRKISTTCCFTTRYTDFDRERDFIPLYHLL